MALELAMSFDAVFLFNKSPSEWLSELRSVLCFDERPISANEVADEWSCYAEITMEPAGWQAIWKVCRSTCEEFCIKFPSYALVQIESVNYQELSAFVSAISVQGNISLPERLAVPLIHLYPLKKQENTVLSIESTANCIDQLRFFYTNIWQPWDLDDDDDSNWSGKHLEQRLNLFFEMRNKEKFPQKLASQIHKKIQKAHHLYERMKELEDILSKEELSGKDFEDNISSPGTRSHGYELFKIHLEFNPLKMEIQILENPTMRTMIKSQFLFEEEKNGNFQYVLVWLEGNTDMLNAYVENIKDVAAPAATIRSAPSLEAAIDLASSGQVVLLHPSIHRFSGRLEVNVTIKGIGEDRVYIKSNESCSHLLNVQAKLVKLENLSLDLKNVECGILVPQNTEVRLSQCRIFGHSRRETVGVAVLTGGSVVFNHCQFDDLHTAVHGYSGGKISIFNSIIQNCHNGLKAGEHVDVEIVNSSIMNCENAGVVYSSLVESNKFGCISLLQKMGNIHMENVKFSKNLHEVEFEKLQTCI